ncbi:MAG: signal peptide peptidase SppA [Deltaproteobacteria bacterium]|nr:MAG: signal peptide peptidase SppA [Deltaproteobacteria bacterium]
MAKTNRPITLVLIILGIAILCFGTLMAIVLSLSRSTPTLSLSNKIGVIPINGVIRDADAITEQLIAFRDDKQIKAIILRINSPGGGVGPSQEIYSETRRTTKTKKVIASLGSVAASGGYYVASAADSVVANPGTLTGSIGVLMEFVRVEELLKKIGVEMQVIKSGEFKDIGSPNRKMTKEEREILTRLLQDIRNQFVTAVSQGRNLPEEKVLELADGRVFSGREAKRLGLVDSLGNFQDAVNVAKRMAHIRGKVKLVYPVKKRRSLLWDLLFKDLFDALMNRLDRPSGLLEYRWNGHLGVFD